MERWTCCCGREYEIRIYAIASTVELYENEPVLDANLDNFVQEGENETIEEQDQVEEEIDSFEAEGGAVIRDYDDYD